MGRRKRTAEEHFLHGSKPRTQPEKQSLALGGYPAYPPHLSKAARAEFKQCIGLMAARGTCTPGDFATLAVYAVVFSRWIECKAAVDRDGLMIEIEVLDSNGSAHVVKRLHPLLKISQDCERQILALASKLGLTPVDRAKVPAAPPDPKAPIDGVIPGSMAALHPEWYGGEPLPKAVLAICPVPAIDEEEELPE